MCAKCGPGAAGFDQPAAVTYYTKQRITGRPTAMALAREYLASVGTVARLREYNQYIQHEAIVLSLRQTLAYRSLADAATYCKSCAFKAERQLVLRKT